MATSIVSDEASTTENEIDIEGLLSDVNTMLSRAAEKAQTDYRQLVVETSNGKPAEPAHLQTVIFSANQSCDSFRRHVKRIGKRRKALADRDRAKLVAGKLLTLEQQRDSLDAECKSIKEKHERELRPLKIEFEQAQDAVVACKQLSSELEIDARSTLNATLPKEYRTGDKVLGDEGFSDPLNIDWS